MAALLRSSIAAWALGFDNCVMSRRQTYGEGDLMVQPFSNLLEANPYANSPVSEMETTSSVRDIEGPNERRPSRSKKSHSKPRARSRSKKHAKGHDKEALREEDCCISSSTCCMCPYGSQPNRKMCSGRKSRTDGYQCKKKPPVIPCDKAEPQSPRNVSPNYKGQREAKVQPVQAVNKFEHVNLHFHLGAEHYSEGEYHLDHTDADAGFRPSDGHCGHPPRPGYFCNASKYRKSQLKEYDWKHCKDTKVGNTYEFHWVFSTGSAGRVHKDVDTGEPIDIEDGLSGAFQYSANPTIIVRAQVCTIVNSDDRTVDHDFYTEWKQPGDGEIVKYIGSTTGPNYANDVSSDVGKGCSPIEVSWHVDTKCCTLSAQSMDNMCMRMKADDLKNDLFPHSTRELVADRWAANLHVVN